MNKPRQINFQVDDDLFEDIETVARRRGQTKSEFIRRAVDKELDEEARMMVI